mmetsp:Transcript_24920/g.80481  ORF Transcript_24920/g.80481 Transcript_24920/m.80481 type:complete len:257 (+) Transcript_24920:1419-2189(+)
MPCLRRLQRARTGSRPHALHDVGGRPQDERSLLRAREPRRLQRLPRLVLVQVAACVGRLRGGGGRGGASAEFGRRKGEREKRPNCEQVAEGTTASGRHTVGKPMMISETGAGGVYEWGDNATASKWTLQYQSAVIGEDVDVALANDRISGISLWHFYDFKVDNCGSTWPCHGRPGQENGTHCTYDHPPPTTFEELRRLGPPNCTAIAPTFRPGGTNHKGVLDFWRRPKPAFAMVAAKYRAARGRPTASASRAIIVQ